MKRILLIATILTFTATLFAQENVTVDVTKLNAQQLQVYQQLKAMQNQGVNIDSITPEKVDKYAQMAKAIGTAINEGLGAVTKNVEQFAQTKAGLWMMTIITWKVVGQDGISLVEKAVQYVIGAPLLFFGTWFFIYIFRRNCVATPLLVSKTKIGWFTYKSEYKGITNPIHGGDGAPVLYGLCYAVFVAICCAIMFIG